VVASANGIVGIEAAIYVLRKGGSALDAVIAGTRLVEANPDDHTVGYSGLPNLVGDVELDASVMDGRGLRAGSVGSAQGLPGRHRPRANRDGRTTTRVDCRAKGHLVWRANVG
jgi:isoaspartyl peptidase/L-asparaginase-like protein (Ntn-hydrolase superfamily)